MFTELPLPPEGWFDSGLERSTFTIGTVPRAYADARRQLEEIVGHPFRAMVANRYGAAHELRLHKDKPDLWGAVAIIGLGAACDFSLIAAGDVGAGSRIGKPGVHFTFEHGDVIYLTEQANRYWHHGGYMPAGRYSLVLREHAPAIG
jgi:alkylated DNA repair dioxygenase AlkB